MEIYEAELLYKADYVISEGPVYDDLNDLLYWIDIKKNLLCSKDFTTGKIKEISYPRHLGSIALCDDGGIIAACDNGIYRLDNRNMISFSIPEEAGDYEIFNDGKCSPDGSFVTGTQMIGGDSLSGHLFRFKSDGTYEVINNNLACSNGLAWDVQKGFMYHIDTSSKRPSVLWRYRYEPDTGRIYEGKVIKDFGLYQAQGYMPDGMTIDTDGNLWIAQWGGYAVSCYNPESGGIIATVNVPAEKVSCCTFGGKDLKTLFITTASGNGDSAGSIFMSNVSARGFNTYRFKRADR